MKSYLKHPDAVGGENLLETSSSQESLRVRMEKISQEIENNDFVDAVSAIRKEIELTYLRLDLEEQPLALIAARELFTRAITAGYWHEAVECCDIIFQATEEREGVIALAHGIWLSVTFPVDPELTVAMLQHLVDETPAHADGAAVAAAAANYIVSLRVVDDNKRAELSFFTEQLLGQVARRHSQIEDQEMFAIWVERMELDDPGLFFPRLAQVLEAIVGESWWFDRDKLRERIPPEGVS
ncbi:MAG: hypothetical protein HQL48_01720 [Gammaproteobacteria bacterium]|nr:hypothetical protein [Gammaproteobacteria bacterium]